mmetsp:Transcript_84398/g.176652  ORF Transcript_84398/g.176652 Transcript_84398/m.176652 type:complete len:107 (+) Transcript_84398:1491-1811(+)
MHKPMFALGWSLSSPSQSMTKPMLPAITTKLPHCGIRLQQSTSFAAARLDYWTLSGTMFLKRGQGFDDNSPLAALHPCVQMPRERRLKVDSSLGHRTDIENKPKPL